MKLGRRKREPEEERVATSLTFGWAPDRVLICEVRDQHDSPMVELEMDRKACRETRDALSRVLRIPDF